MAKINVIVILYIAILLSVTVWFEYIRPLASLFSHKREYITATTECYELTAEYEALRSAASRSDAETETAIFQSTTIALMGCFPKENMKAVLLANGVSPYTIQRLDLVALDTANVNVGFVVKDIMASQ